MATQKVATAINLHHNTCKTPLCDSAMQLDWHKKGSANNHMCAHIYIHIYIYICKNVYIVVCHQTHYSKDLLMEMQNKRAINEHASLAMSFTEGKISVRYGWGQVGLSHTLEAPIGVPANTSMCAQCLCIGILAVCQDRWSSTFNKP